MIDSVLNSIKKSLGIEEEYEAFDEDITMHINSVFSTLFSIGASPPTPFMIMGKEEKWTDFYGEIKQAMMVKTYVYLKVRLIFDPPATSFAQSAFEKQATEMEWRLGIMEFVFNPLSRPISYEESRELRQLNDKINEVEYHVVTLDEEVDAVPDLTQIFHKNLEE